MLFAFESPQSKGAIPVTPPPAMPEPQVSAQVAPVDVVPVEVPPAAPPVMAVSIPPGLSATRLADLPGASPFQTAMAGRGEAVQIASLQPGGEGQQIWHTLDVHADDITIQKNRYSALIPGSSSLERVLRGYGIENVLVAGTKTNVCCEVTGRDAMMLDFNVVMVSDCLAALSDDEHRASLETFIQQFGDVMDHNEVLVVLRNKPN